MAGPRFLLRPTCRFGALLLVILGAARPLCGQDAARNSSRECAICHIRWVDALARSATQGDAMEGILERKAGSGDMCLSCHDGSVIDSRFKVWSTRHHTTDSLPSPRVNIPTEKFPLDDQGRMTCATCHTAHAVPDSSDLKTVVFLRQPNIDSSLCLACHPEHAQKSDCQHPLGRKDSPVPQAILEAGGKTSTDGRMILCQTCHEPHGARNAWMLVLPPSKLCIACHTDKAPETAPVSGAPVHRIGRTYPGFEPPATLLDERATFGPDGELDCLSCHRLHDASGARPLLIRKNENGSLCLECHKDEKTVIESPHDLRISSPETVNAAGQTPSVSGACGVCHRIHGWARDVPDANLPHSSACMECHRTGGPGSRNRPYVEAHPVGIPLPEKMSIPLPLDPATGHIGCLTCHDPHTPRSSESATEGASLITSLSLDEDPNHSSVKAPRQDVGSQVHTPRSFLRAEGSQLCVICHDKMADLLTGPHNPAEFEPKVRQLLGLHPSVGSCRVCHTTHNAQGVHLWAQTPATPPDGSISNLCGACHEEKQRIKGSLHDPGSGEWAKKLGFVSKDPCIDCHMVHGSREAPGPVGEGGIWGLFGSQGDADRVCETCHRAGAPGKVVETPHLERICRDDTGNLPVNREGRIQCATCHDIHQNAQNPKLLRTTRWDSSLCLACHPREVNELLGTPHDLRTSAPDARNLRGETAVESGACGSCHLVHCASDGAGVWVQSSTSEKDFGRGLCTCCHRKGGCAETRIPKYVEHPDVALLNRTDPRKLEYMPTFDHYGEPSSTGSISCLTCHKFHTPPSTPDAGEGPTRFPYKFLRTEAHERLCIDCHGIEALWRFLYYHKENRYPNPGHNLNPASGNYKLLHRGAF